MAFTPQADDLVSQLRRLMARMDEADRRQIARAITDGAGTQVVATDTVSGGGLAYPLLSMPMAPSRVVDWWTSTSATFETVGLYYYRRQSPRMRIIVGLGSLDAATNGEARFLINSVATGVVAKTTSPAVAFAFTLAIPGAHLDEIPIELQIRRTTGTGSIAGMVLGGYSWPS